MHKIPRRILISHAAYLQIAASIEHAANQYETGGVLIGYTQKYTNYIEAVTVPINNANATKTSFVLNGEAHTKLAQEIINSSDKPLTLLGVWHSHICDVAKFSQQDRDANRTLSTKLNGALSVLVTWRKHTTAPKIKGYYIAPDYSEHYQTIFIRKVKKMEKQNRCSNCVYWRYRKCAMTGQIKNDSICNCGQFKEKGNKE